MLPFTGQDTRPREAKIASQATWPTTNLVITQSWDSRPQKRGTQGLKAGSSASLPPLAFLRLPHTFPLSRRNGYVPTPNPLWAW